MKSDAEAAGKRLTPSLRLLLTDLTGGTHALSVEWNGDDLPLQTVSGETSYQLDLDLPTDQIICGDNLLKLSLDSGDPGVLSEARIDDVQVLVAYE